MKPVNVLVVADRFWPQYAGWISQTLSMIAAVSSRTRDLRFSVWIPDTHRKDQSAPVEGVEVFYLPLAPFHLSGSPRLSYLSQASAWLAAHRRQFDVLYFPRLSFASDFLIPFGRALGKPCAARIARGELDQIRTLKMSLRRKALRTAGAVVGLNHAALGAIHAIGIPAEKSYWIPNGVDLCKYYPVCRREKERLRASFGIQTHEVAITFSGIVCERKGVDQLIEAFHQLILAGCSVRLMIAGPSEGTPESDPSFLEKIQHRIEAWGIEEKVKFLGMVDQLAPVLQASDLFALPSLAEGMPNALLEAMATGLPCVGTDIPGIREVIQPEVVGLLVPPGNVSELTQAVGSMVNHPKLRESYGEAAHVRVEQNFSITKTSMAYQNLFSQLVIR